jgi:hypothetical protein
VSVRGLGEMDSVRTAWLGPTPTTNKLTEVLDLGAAEVNNQKTTLNNGYLGSRIDEERSELR